jgi:hypothetical protein
MIEPETLTFDRVLVWDETRREWTYVRGDLLDALTEDAELQQVLLDAVT